MELMQAVDKFIDMLRPLDVDETKFYDIFPAIRRNDPPVEVLNIHGVRLFAAIAGIGITEGSTKVLQEPTLEERVPGSEIVVCSHANWPYSYSGEVSRRLDTDNNRGYYAEITQSLFWAAKEGKDARLNPNYRETAISRAERNAMLGLIPARYLIFMIKQLTKEKQQMLTAMDKTNKARIAARAKAGVLEENGIASIDTLEAVKALKGESIDDWGEPEWRYLEMEFDKVIAEQVSREPGDESIEEQADSLPEAEIPIDEDVVNSEEF